MADHPQNGAAPDKDRGAAFWDAKFAASDYVYGTRPNAFVADQSYRLNPGSRLLAVADHEAGMTANRGEKPCSGSSFWCLPH